MFSLSAKTKCQYRQWLQGGLQPGVLRKRLSEIAVALALIGSPAAANDLAIMGSTNDFEGSTTEFSSPDGISCRYRASERPSLTIGAGVSRGVLIPGLVTNNLYVPPEISDPEPVVGIMFRMPLGAKGKDCDKFIAIEEAMMRYNKAYELFDMGIIEQEQLEEIARKTFAVLNDF